MKTRVIRNRPHNTSRTPLWLEALEKRTLLATNMWINSTGGSWQTASNWSLNHVPASGEDVVIPELSGTQTITYSSGSSTIQSLTSSETVDLTGGNLDVTGTIEFSSGQLTLDGATLSGGSIAAGSQATWNSGALAGSVTNAGTITVTGTSTMLVTGTLSNTGTIAVTGSGTVFAGGNSTTINNDAGATFDFQSDVSLYANGFSSLTFNNAGTLMKSAGTGTSAIGGFSLNDSGTVEADSGTLSLTAGGSGTNGVVSANGAGIVSLSGNYSGSFTGSGTGTVLLDNFTGTGPSGATLDFSGSVLQWNAGTLAGTITNAGTLTAAPGGTKNLTGTLTNAGTVAVTDSINTAANNTTIDNLAGATFDFQTDVALANNDSNGQSYTGLVFDNAGTLKKSAGTGTSTVNYPVSSSGTVEGDSGTLSLSAGVTGIGTGATTINANGGTVSLQGNSSGSFTGSGTGTVLLDNFTGTGPSGATLDFSGSVLQWNAGTLGGTITNAGTLTAAPGGTKNLTGTLTNAGTVAVTDSINTAANNTTIDNLAGATFDFQTDAALANNDSNGQICTGLEFDNAGTIEKSAGTGTTDFDYPLNDTTGGEALVNTSSGELFLQGDGDLQGSVTVGGSVTLYGSTFAVSDGTAITPLAGGGALQVDSADLSLAGTLTSAILTIAGNAVLGGSGTLGTGSLVTWTGGTLSGSITNAGTLTAATGGTKYLTGMLTNAGTVAVNDDIYTAANNTTIDNLAGATFDFQTDASLANYNPFGGQSYTGLEFENAGTIKKSAGTGTSTVEYPIGSSGTIEGDSGTLSLSAGIAGIGTGATTINANGGTVSLQGNCSGSFTGSGTGAVLLNNFTGTGSGGATLDFPGSVLQWNAGTLGGTITNAGALTVAPGGTKYLTGMLTNARTVAVTDYIYTAANNTTIDNLAGATFDFQTDAALANYNSSGQICTGLDFDNSGTIEKSAGTGTTDFDYPLDDTAGGEALVNTSSGELFLQGGGDLQGSVAVGGVVTLYGSTFTASDGTAITPLAGGGAVQVNGAALNLAGTLTSAILTIAGGVLGGTGTLGAGSLVTWTGGTLSGSITNAGTLTVAPGGTKYLSGMLTNAGTVAVNDNIYTTANNTAIDNLAGATFDFQSDASLNANVFSTFNNAGTLMKSAGTGTSSIDYTLSSPPETATAIYDVESGTLNVPSGSIQLDGSGILTGQPQGTLEIRGSLTGTTQNVDQFKPPGTVVLTGGTASSPLLLEAMGQDLGSLAAGFTNNFVYGEIELGGGTYVRLVDNARNSAGTGQEAVYVNSLDVPSGSTLDLNGLNVYCLSDQIDGTISGGMVTQIAPGGPIALGDPTAGSILTANEADVFSIYGRAGESIALVVNTGSSGVPPPLSPGLNYAQVELLDPSGNVLATASNGQAGANSFIPATTLAADGVYQIKVSAAPAQASSTGNFLLTAYDATVKTENAPLNQPVYSQLDSTYDQDQWTFSAVANQLVTFDRLASGNAALQFTLTGPNNFVGFEGLTSTSALVLLPASGTYTLSATGASGAYAFQINQNSQTNQTLGTPYQGTLAGSGQAQSFVVDFPKAGPMTLQLEDPNTGDHVELYARLGAPPTREVYGYGANGGGASQNILIPSAAAGTWYVLAYAEAAAPGSFTLQANATSVLITSVTPSSYAANDAATLTLNGAGFTNTMSVALVASNNTTVCQASSVSFNTVTQLTATMNLSGVPQGTYSVLVTNTSGGRSVLPAAFTVTAAGQADLQTQLILPSAIGRHIASTFYIEYSNTGTAAMPAPVLLLESSFADDLPLFTLDKSLVVSGFWTSALPTGYSNTVEILASGKVPGVLEPGESVTVPVYYAGMQMPWSFNEAQFKFDLRIFNTTDTDSVDWTSLQSTLQPAGITDAEWAPVYQNLASELVQLGTSSDQGGSIAAGVIEVGNRDLVGTWGGYVQLLDNEASFLGQLGEDVTDVNQLWGFAVQQADNALSPVGPDMASATDDSVAIPGSLSLSFSRVFASSIIGRDTMGPLGLGWSTPWQTTASTAADGTVTITGAGGAERVFQPDSRAGGAYFSEPGDTGTLTSDANGGYLLTEADGTASDYNPNGTLNYIQDTNGNRITAGYTGGLLTSLTAWSGQSITIGHNAAGLISSVSDSDGRTTTYTYDSRNQHLLSVTAFNGQTTAYTYQNVATAVGLIPQPSPVQNALASITFPGGTHQYFTYDSEGRLAGTSSDGGAEPQSFAYALGEVNVTDGTGDTSHLFYNEQGLVVKSIDPLGNVTLNAYDGNFNLTSVTNALGESETYTYNAAGEVTTSTDFLGNTTNFSYSGPFNELSSMTDANGNTTGYLYSSAGDLLTTTYANGTSQSSTYDPEGNATSFLNANGQPINYTYNAAGQVLTESFSDGSQYVYNYDADGNMLTATDATGTITFTYDPTTELLTKVAYPSNLSLTFTYNAAGQRTSMVDQTGFTTNYTYDSVGRLSMLTDGNGNVIVTYTYDADGRLSEKVNGNGTYTAYQYDEDGDVLHLINYAPGGAINSRFDYTYNALGLETAEDTLDGDWNYTYDADGQLIQAVFASTNPSVPSQDLAYSYDAMGNRITTIINGVTTAYTSNDMNEYTSVGGIAYTYDADGNLKSDGSNSYSYNSLNQLISVAGPSGTTTYTYNALGQQVASTTNGQTTQYLIDPSGLGNVVGQYTGGGTLIAEYTYGLGLTSQITANDDYYYDFDAMGSTSGLTTSSGDYVANYDYAPFGNVISSHSAIQNPFQFAGEEGIQIDGQNLAFARARFIGLTTGRFLTADPSGLLGGDANAYRYAFNQPLTLVDASGLGIIGRAYNTASGFLPTPWTPPAPLGYFLNGAAQMVGYRLVSYYGVSGDTAFFVQSLVTGSYVSGLGTVGALPVYYGDYWIYENSGTVQYRMMELMDYLPWGDGVVGHDDLAIWADNWDAANPWLGNWLLSLQEDFNGLFPKPPGGSGGDTGSCTEADSEDPNSMLGPAGYGPSNFITDAGTAFPYQINFENASSATAPAQSVTITDQLDSNLNWTTFQLAGIQWGDTILSIPAGSQ